MRLRIRATPNAKRSEILGWDEDPFAGSVLKVRVAAPPVEGKANDELRSFLAKQLGLSRSQVVMEKGDASRIKTFVIPDGTRLPG